MSRNLPSAQHDSYGGHELAQVAQLRLQKTPYPTIQRLSCDCRGSTLVLRGRLPSFYHKQLAQEAVGRIEGITQVLNEIEVVG